MVPCVMVPALCISRSRRAWSRAKHSVSRLRSLSCAESDTYACAGESAFIYLVAQRAEPAGLTTGKTHGDCMLGECVRNRSPDAAARAGNERNPICEVSLHGRWRSVSCAWMSAEEIRCACVRELIPAYRNSSTAGA